MNDRAKAYGVLTMNTLAFTVCFAVWMMNGVLVTFLVDNKIYELTKAQMGWLIGIPVLTGSLLRLPVGVLTDKYGGRIVYAGVMLVSAAGAFLSSFANGFWSLFAGGLAFGIAGTSFAVGIAYTSVWFPDRQQGTALGIFGAGNAGAAVTSLAAPAMLRAFTAGGANPDGWRTLPRLYAGALVVMTVVFWLFTHHRRVEHGRSRTLAQRLEPLKSVQVWRFGLYYFLVFGGFVALAQWLIPYYVNAYAVTVAMAGVLAAIFSLPSGVIRALGGWLSDRFGARTVMYWVLGGTAAACILLVVPRMDIYAPGEGLMAPEKGVVTAVTETTLELNGKPHPLVVRPPEGSREEGNLIWPATAFWNEPVVKVGDTVVKKQLLARGVTHIYFQANIWVFTALVFIVGILMGIGKAAVYKHIPHYFPTHVGVVGGIVGVIGGLGGFVGPIFFGYMLKGTGLWTSCWMFFAVISIVSLAWMHQAIKRMMANRAPDLAERIDEVHARTAARTAGAAPAAGRDAVAGAEKVPA